MSGDRSRAALIALLLTGVGCGGGGGGGDGVPSPSRLAIAPATGYSGHTTPVVITGDNFLARTTGAALDTRHHAWLGATPLVDVTWIDAHTLHASVPAGLPAGTLALRVRNAYGKEGTLPAAFTVQTSPGGALAVTAVEVTPGEANVGQSVTVTATIGSVGDAAVGDVVPSLPVSLVSPAGGAASVTDGPNPASVDALAPGASTTFTWTVRATAAGSLDELGNKIPLALPVTASGEDAFSGELVRADARAGSLRVDEPAGLTATVVAGRTAANVGQAVPVSFTISNGGTATANLDAPTPAASLAVAGGGAGSATCTTPTPAGATTLGTHGNRTFTWTCTATAAGLLTVSGTVTGTDANTGAPLSATPAAADAVTVQTAATLSATASIRGSPAAVNVGQTLTIDLTVSDGGTAPAHVTGVTPTFSPPTTSCAAAAPDPPLAVPGGGSVLFTWTCTPAGAGTLTLGATVAGTDDNTGAAVTASASGVSVPVQLPAALVAIPSAAPTTVDVDQTVAASLLVYNGNGAAADLTAVTPELAADGTAAATCTAATPAPAPIPALGHATFTWTCTPTSAGTLRLTATVAGTDHNSGADLRVTPAPFPVIVQTPASVAVTGLVVDRGTVNVGQGAVVTASLRNSGGADARVTIVPSAAPTGPACAPTPAAGQLLAGGGGTLSASWTCTAGAAGAYAYGAAITAVGVNSGRSTSPAATPVPVAVQPPAALTAALSLARPTLDLGQAVTATLTVTNTGGATASVSRIAPDAVAGTGAVTCDPAPRETLPASLPGGGSAAFTWSCTGAAVGTATLRATVAGTDGNSGAAVGAAAPDRSATVQAPAALTATLTATPTTFNTAQSTSVTLTVANAGGGEVLLTQLVPSPAAGAVACPPAPAEALGAVAGGATVTYHWTCAAAAVGAATLDATVAGTAVNSGLELRPEVAGVRVDVVEPPPSLGATLAADAATVAVGATVRLTLTVANAAGAGSATLTGVAPSSSAAGTLLCDAAPEPGDVLPVTLAGGASAAFHWRCAGVAAGAADAGAEVTAGAAGTFRSPTVTVTVGAAPGVPLEGSIASSPATLPRATGGDVTVYLTLRNPVGALRVLLAADAVSPQVGAGDAAGFTCRSPTLAPVAVAAGDTLGTTITWTCTSRGGPAGATTFGARVTAVDAGGRDCSATITGGVVLLQ